MRDLTIIAVALGLAWTIGWIMGVGSASKAINCLQSDLRLIRKMAICGDVVGIVKYVNARTTTDDGTVGQEGE